MYPGETPNPKSGPHGPGDHQPNLLSKRVTDRSASGPHAGRSPTLAKLGGKGQGRYRPRPLAQNQNWTGCSCHRFAKPEVDVAPVATGKGNGTHKNQPPRLTQANKRLRMSEGIGTPDDGRRFDDLPLLSEKGGDKSEDKSEDNITEFRGRPARSRTEKASDTRNQRRTVEEDTNDERALSKHLPNDIADIIGGPIDGPDDAFVPPEWLMEAIKDVYNTHTPSPQPNHQSDS
jgi:hypothetical protein